MNFAWIVLEIIIQLYLFCILNFFQVFSIFKDLEIRSLKYICMKVVIVNTLIPLMKIKNGIFTKWIIVCKWIGTNAAPYSFDQAYPDSLEKQLSESFSFSHFQLYFNQSITQGTHTNTFIVKCGKLGQFILLWSKLFKVLFSSACWIHFLSSLEKVNDLIAPLNLHSISVLFLQVFKVAWPNIFVQTPSNFKTLIPKWIDIHYNTLVTCRLENNIEYVLGRLDEISCILAWGWIF